MHTNVGLSFKKRDTSHVPRATKWVHLDVYLDKRYTQTLRILNVIVPQYPYCTSLSMVLVSLHRWTILIITNIAINRNQPQIRLMSLVHISSNEYFSVMSLVSRLSGEGAFSLTWNMTGWKRRIKIKYAHRKIRLLGGRWTFQLLNAIQCALTLMRCWKSQYF